MTKEEEKEYYGSPEMEYLQYLMEHPELITKEQREEYHQEEANLFNKLCEHKNIKEVSIIHPDIGIEYYDVCADCGEDAMSLK